MTITLLLNSEGKKMGKTASGAVWLDPNKTTPFDFYQYWRNVGDADVLKCIRMLTFLPLEQIDAMDAWEGSQLNQAKEILAYELTKLVHGEAEADKAQEAARALMMERLREALATLTPRQASCLHARFWEGKQFKEIAEAEGFTTSAAIVTVRNAIIKLQKYYIKRGWMKPPKEKAICTKKSPPKRNRKKTSAKKS